MIRSTRAMLVLILLAAGYAAGGGVRKGKAPVHRVPLEAGLLGGVAWLPDDWLVVSGR